MIFTICRSKPVSPKPQLHNTQLYSPYDHPENSKTAAETELLEKKGKEQIYN